MKKTYQLMHPDGDKVGLLEIVNNGTAKKNGVWISPTADDLDEIVGDGVKVCYEANWYDYGELFDNIRALLLKDHGIISERAYDEYEIIYVI